MIFDIKHTSKKVQDAYSIAAEVLTGGDIVDRLMDIRTLTYTSKTPRDVICDLLFHTDSIVSGLTPKIPVLNYYSRSNSVIATTFSDKFGIFVNDKHVNSRSSATYIRNGAHEFGHLPMGYGHGSNWTRDTWKGRAMCRILGDKEDKNMSVSYILEEVVLQIAKEKRMVRI